MKKIVALLLAALMIFSVCASLADTFREGDTVYFGHYEQDTDLNNGAERIRWLVIQTKGSQLMLLSEKGLDRFHFNEASDGTTWEESAIRRWLNNEFLYTAFSSSERQAIVTTRVEDTLEHTNRNWNSGGRYGGITSDKVFLLSYKEMNDLVSKNDRFCEPSYALFKKGIYTENHNGRRVCWYWLRTSAYRNNAVVVDTKGKLDTCYIHHNYGVVRPAIWVESNAVSRY